MLVHLLQLKENWMLSIVAKFCLAYSEQNLLSKKLKYMIFDAKHFPQVIKKFTVGRNMAHIW
jgi:hypothetical protein